MIETAYLTRRQRIQRIAAWLWILLVVFFVGRFVWDVITTGTIIVTTDSPSASINVSSAPTPLGKVSTTRQGTGSLTTHVHAGDYVVSVKNTTTVTNQTIHIGWRATKTVHVSSPKLTATEPVLYEDARSITADSDRLAFLSEQLGVVYVNRENEEESITGTQSFTSIEWADAQYGIAQDDSGGLYVVNGEAVHPLRTSISDIGGVDATYAVAPNKTIYIGVGSYVYRGTEQAGFRKIYTKFSANDRLIATNNQVLVLNPKDTGGKGTGVILKTNGEEVDKKFDTALSGWTPWSQNGKYIVISVGQEPTIFSSSLTKIGSISQPLFTDAGDSSHSSVIDDGAWLGDNTFFYHYSGQLWSHDVAKDASSIVATIPNNNLILSVAVSTDGSYVYATTAGNDNLSPTAVYRVGLRGQPVSSFFSQLQSILPVAAPNYSIGLRNFSGSPTIVIYPVPGTDQNDDLQSAESNLQGVIDTTTTKFEISDNT